MLWYYYPRVDPENLRPKNYLQRYIIVPYPRNKIFLAKITQYHQLLFYFENNVSQMKSPKDLVWENIVKISQFVVLISNVMCNFFQNPQHIPWTFSFRNILSNIHCELSISYKTNTDENGSTWCWLVLSFQTACTKSWNYK